MTQQESGGKYFGHRVVAEVDSFGLWLAFEATPCFAPVRELCEREREQGGGHAVGVDAYHNHS